MDERHNTAAFERQVAANVCQSRSARNARTQRLTVKPLHDEAFAQIIVTLQHVIHFGFRHADCPGTGHQQRFGCKARSDAHLAFDHDATRCTAHA